MKYLEKLLTELKSNIKHEYIRIKLILCDENLLFADLMEKKLKEQMRTLHKWRSKHEKDVNEDN